MHYNIFRNMAHYLEAPHDSLPYHENEVVERLVAMTGRERSIVTYCVSQTRTGNRRMFIGGQRGHSDALVVRIAPEG
jgi:hypothetical protein